MSDSKLTGYNGKLIFSHQDTAFQELMELAIQIVENKDNEEMVANLANRIQRIVHNESVVADLLKTAQEGKRNNGHVQKAIDLIVNNFLPPQLKPGNGNGGR